MTLEQTAPTQPKFGTTGIRIVQVDPGGVQSLASTVAIQPDGKIVVGGYITSDPKKFAVARFCPNGDLDTGSNCSTLLPKFGVNGTVIFPVGSTGEEMNDLEVDGDGKIVAVGWTFDASYNQYLAMARFCPDGLVDTGTNCSSLQPKFGTGGKVVQEVRAGGSATANAVAIDSDGRLVVAGNTVNAAYDDGARAGGALHHQWNSTPPLPGTAYSKPTLFRRIR